MSTGDFLFQGTAPTSWTTTSKDVNSMPAWWQDASKSIISRASGLAAEPYQTYGGPRVAELDPLQKQAYENANGYAPGVNNNISGGTDLTRSGSELFNEGDFNKFMSPYTEGVVDRIAQLGQRNLSENLLPQVNDTFIKSGQFGSSGNADFTLRALRDTNESILGQQATALENAQKQAMSSYQAGQGRQLEAGQQLGALGALQGQEGRDQLTFTNAMGAQQQGQGQQNLDVAYQDFLRQQEDPINKLNLVNSALRGYAPTESKTSYATNVAPGTGALSPLQTATGVLQTYGGNRTA